jgi:hypothetical protein
VGRRHRLVIVSGLVVGGFVVAEFDLGAIGYRHRDRHDLNCVDRL